MALDKCIPRGILYINFLFLLSCVQPKSVFESIPSGPWRGVLLLDRMPVVKYGDDRDIKKNFDFDTELPFTFEVGMEGKDSMFVEFHNGIEKIKIYDVTYGRATPSSRDTIRINFVAYDTYITAVYEDGILEGNWVVSYKENYAIPFKAVYGQNHRFAHENSNAEFNVDGKWKTIFEPGTESEYPAIGDFLQKGNVVTGTFLTENGDYRYLHGNIIKNKMYLSAFDGAHAFLFYAKFIHSDSITGSFRSGKHYTAPWLATKNKEYNLKDAYEITQKVNDMPLDFKLPNTEDSLISINDQNYHQKIKLVQIMGTWCPNCFDEAEMLQKYFKEKNPHDVAWISLAFERYEDKATSIQQIQKYKKKLGLDHEILWAGSYKKQEASKLFPQLSGISSYPTLLIVDKNNKIRHIYTGFSGPATKEYKSHQERLENIIETLRHENQKE
ncbi:MAG: TlpA disulfide reductase family protein [Saprospiraceae bacterium]